MSEKTTCEVSIDEITSNPQSLLDPRGKLFIKDNIVYRAIPTRYAPFYHQLLTSPSLNELVGVGLISTDTADLQAEGYPLIVRHHRVEFVSCWREWSSLMMQDAAIMVCNLNLELLRFGLGTQDGHPWNVLFEFAHPTYVDFTSIVSLEESSYWATEWADLFRRCWVLPLVLMAKGHPAVARSISKAIDIDEPIDRLFANRRLRWYPLWYHRIYNLRRTDPKRFFSDLRDRIASLSMPSVRTAWSDYYIYTGHPAHNDLAAYGTKPAAIRRLLESCRPSTLTDIGCNKGWYSILAAKMGIKVIAFDIDEECIDALYQQSRANNLSILPLLLDFTAPTPAHGRKVEFPGARERLVGDMAIMLALIHHLVFTVGMTFERITQVLASFTRRHAIVEFVPAEDPHVQREFLSTKPGFEWYRLDYFVRAMERRFRLLDIVDSDSPRKLLVFERI